MEQCQDSWHCQNRYWLAIWLFCNALFYASQKKKHVLLGPSYTFRRSYKSTCFDQLLAFSPWVTGATRSDFSRDLVVFHWYLVIFCEVCLWRRSVVLFLIFQPFLCKEWIAWIVVWRLVSTEQTSFSNLSFLLFSLLCRLLLQCCLWSYFHFFAGSLY